MITAIVGSAVVIAIVIQFELRLENERDKRLAAIQDLVTLQNAYSALYISSNAMTDEYNDLVEEYNEKFEENIK